MFCVKKKRVFKKIHSGTTNISIYTNGHHGGAIGLPHSYQIGDDDGVGYKIVLHFVNYE